MNLTEALTAALPELPARRPRATVPRLDPVIVAREQVQEGKTVVVAHRPGTSDLITLSPEQWQVLELFDGERSYADIGAACQEVIGVAFSEEEIRDFASSFDAMDIWFKTPQERNFALMQKLAEERARHSKKKAHIDVAHMQFSAWDPDKFVTWIYPYCKWMYSGWFTALTLVGFGFMTYVFIDRWSEIGGDTLKYYTFTDKTFGDLAEFWLLFLALGFFHESAHALTCKHYGGGVHRMGFHLIYLTPAFFVDVTEAWVYANRWQRLATIIAGIWVELIFCALATIVWWGTPPGTFVHEFAYKIILITGVAVVIVNLNPLIKLDGYYFFSDLLDVQQIKERSTAYLSGLVKRHIWRLPVEIEFVPRKLRWLFLPYAVLSGIYSYTLLLVAINFAKNIFAKFNPQWAFLPATILGFYVFRSRIRTLVRFMHSVYLDKREWLHALAKNPLISAPAIALVLILLFAPIWKDNVEGSVVLEPATRATLRAQIGGFVTAANGSEGSVVQAGQTVLELSDLDIESQVARHAADFRLASLQQASAQMRYADLGRPTQETRAAQAAMQLVNERSAALRIKSPITGTLLTPRIQDRIGSYVKEGTELAEVADLSSMRARIYLPEFDVGKVQPGEAVKIYLFTAGSVSGTIESVSSQPQELPAGLRHKEDYKGIREANFYPAIAVVPNDGKLVDGMSGVAKVFVQRRSSMGLVWKVVREFTSRKVW
jgi:putative peptide zinc metalloprotease protein